MNLNIPSTLAAWDLKAIRELLENRIAEPRIFDFKESLPHRKDDVGKERLKKICASFANDKGGFLVFGVKDDRQLQPKQRLVGFAPTEKFLETFATYCQSCIPPIEQSPHREVTLEDGNKIYVIHIPTGRNRPYATGSQREGFKVPVRTDQGTTEFLNWDQIGQMFLKTQTSESVLRELAVELDSLAQQVFELKSIRVPQPDRVTRSFVSVPGNPEVDLPPIINLERLEDLLSRGGAALVDSETLGDLAQLRRSVSDLNQKLDHLRSQLEEIGELPRKPDASARESDRTRWTEDYQDVIARRGEVVKRFNESCRQQHSRAHGAARRAAAGFRRSLPQ